MTKLVAAFERHPLLEALNLVGRVRPWQRAIPREDKEGRPLPPKMIPGVVRIDLTPKGAVINCANFEMSLQTAVPCQPSGEGRMFLPLDAFSAAVEKAPRGAMIELHSDGTSVAMISGRFKAGTHAEPTDACPEMPAIQGPAVTLPVSLLRDGLKSTEDAAIDDSKRPWLGGIYIHDGPSGPAFAAMDSVRIHSRAMQGNALGFGAILPHRIATLLASLLPEEGEVLVQAGKAGACFAWGSTIFRTKLIDAQYPSYAEQLNVPTNRVLRAHADQLLADLELVAIVAHPKYQDVQLQLSPESSLASAMYSGPMGTDRGEVQLDAEFEGAPLRIGFQLRLVAEALSLFGEKRIEWRMAEPRSPTIISSPDAPGLEAMVAPFMQAGHAPTLQAA